MITLTIPITGMSCGGCANSVRDALEKIPGVSEAQVIVGSARVTYDPATTTPDSLGAAVTRAGFVPVSV